MDNGIYTSLSRQSSLMREMTTIANNIANLATTGFRKEGVVFAEYIHATDSPAGSLSMGTAKAHVTSQAQGALAKTGGTYDFALEGEGFFAVQTPDGPRLTRAGSFTPDAQSILVNPDGYPLLDNGQAPIFVPQDLGKVALAADGTLSAGDVPLAQVGTFMPADLNALVREDGVRFRVDGDFFEAQTASVVQGYLESSNVDPVTEIARMIEVQRSYELGQGFLDKEDARIKNVLQTLGRA